MCQRVHVCQLKNKHAATLSVSGEQKKNNPKNRQALDSNHDYQSSCVCKPADADSQFSSWTQHGSVEAEQLGLFTQSKIASLNPPQFQQIIFFF